MAAESPGLIVGMSNANLSRRDTLLFDAEDYEDFLWECHYDTIGGLEVTPVRIPTTARALGELAASGTVGSQQQSWRETNFGDVMRTVWTKGRREATGQLALIAAMPRPDGYRQLARHQRHSLNNLPLIIHPDSQHLGDQPPRAARDTYPADIFDTLWVQLTAEDIAAHNADILHASPEEKATYIAGLSQERGLGIVADLHHVFATRRNNHTGETYSFGSEEDIIAMLYHLYELGAIAEWQVAFRPDFGGPQSQLQQAAENHLENTPQGRALEAIKDRPGSKRIITEIAADEIAKLPDVQSYRRIHAIIAQGIRRILE